MTVNKNINSTRISHKIEIHYFGIDNFHHSKAKYKMFNLKKSKHAFHLT